MEDTKIFNQPIPTNNIPRNFTELGNYNILTVRAGELVPVFAQRLMPDTDIKEANTEIFGRLMPLINPIYGRYRLFTYHFFVPTRISFPHFDRFRAGKKVKGLNSAPYNPLYPRLTLSKIAIASCYSYLRNAFTNSGWSAISSLNYVGFWTNSLCDYLNLPCTNEISFRDPVWSSEFENLDPTQNNTMVLIDNPIHPRFIVPDGQIPQYFSLLTQSVINPDVLSYFGEEKDFVYELNIEKFIDYTLIWYDYFRDWRIDDYEFSPYDFIAECSHDNQNNYGYYFNLDFVAQHEQLNWFALRKRSFTSDMFISAFPTPQLGDAMNIPQFTDFSLFVSNFSNSDVNTSPVIDGDGLLSLTSNTSPARFQFSGIIPTIDDFHKAEQLQKYYQMLLVHGISQQQLDKMFYGVNSSLPFDKPIYLGGKTYDFEFSEVIQTSQTTSDSPLGDFAGHGRVHSQSTIKQFTTDEFGYYFVLVAVVPNQAYFQGLPREFTRYLDVYDLPNHLFANLGFDNIENQELFFDIPNNGDNPISIYQNNKSDFGYMTRYIDQRTHNDEIHGSFRGTLMNWHNSRFFASTPPLNVNFTNVDWKSFERVFAVQEYNFPNIQLYVKNTLNVIQPLQYYCNPF